MTLSTVLLRLLRSRGGMPSLALAFALAVLAVQPAAAQARLERDGVVMTAKEGPYQFRIFVRLAHRPGEIEFAVSARSPHPQPR